MNNLGKIQKPQINVELKYQLVQKNSGRKQKSRKLNLEEESTQKQYSQDRGWTWLPPTGIW